MNRERIKVVIQGAVQGVGFRPFVYRLATELGLKGWATNSAQGVLIEAEGARNALNQFLLRLEVEKPPRAIIQGLEFSFLEPVGLAEFKILVSEDRGEKSAFILPDLAPCADCLRELFDPANRRYLYPFINCTNCGPRFSIIEALPYDRPHTSMKKFRMCDECRGEYEDPGNRRFHAQPNSCCTCGPQVELWDRQGERLAEREEAWKFAAESVRQGMIVALKGVGGFQLIVDARNEDAVRRLRQRKAREEKPLAVMYLTLAELREDCEVNDFEARLLIAAEAPIVLLSRNTNPSRLAKAVAPGNPNLGAMMPSSPLHHILLRELNFPVVATSGNLSNEPICIDENEALSRLGNIADVFLIHDRPIVRQLDDSVLRIIDSREMMLRRARGYAPLPISCGDAMPSILAVGGHLKNTVAFSRGREIFVSQHIGDLETVEAYAVFQKVVADLPALYDSTPEITACDLHPEYLSTKYARTSPGRLIQVQHHFAHALSCMAENELDGPALGIVWDGTGLGLDGTIWGGEFLRVNRLTEETAGEPPFQRVAHLRPFCLPGGDAAIKQPRRAALGLLWEILKEKVFNLPNLWVTKQFSPSELAMMRRILEGQLNSPMTSSAGRLFDAVSSLIGIRNHCGFEGQAAMELEFAVRAGVGEEYPFGISEGDPWVIDWEPMVLAILEDLERQAGVAIISAKFHNTLVEMMVAVAKKSGETQIILSGGCFQNKYLLERAIFKIREAGLQPYWHQRLPTNDGGISVGQIIAAHRQQCCPSGLTISKPMNVHAGLLSLAAQTS